MSLPTHWLESKTLMIALLVLAREIAAQFRVGLDAPLATICRDLKANRTSVYEQMQRIFTALETLVNAQPGRPAKPAEEPAQDHASLLLTIAVLDFRLLHPGSVVQGQRLRYAPCFQRFILEQHDLWEGTDETFAQAVRVPLDTLRDWWRRDRQGLLPEPEEKKSAPIPRSASELTRKIADEWQRWVGSPRAFFGHIARHLGVSPGQTRQVLKILGLISTRRPKAFRYRGSTQRLSPGTLLVTDGKRLHLELTGSGRSLSLTWQAMVDQTTGCHMAWGVAPEENAQGVLKAYESSRTWLGETVPQGLLHDNKPCYEERELQEHVQNAGTTLIPTTLGRAENKAGLEGDFGLFEQRVGTLRLDDSSMPALIQSAVEEMLRAYTAALNSIPRVEWDGHSRLQVLRQACPSPEQKRRDQQFLARLKASHPGTKRRKPKIDPTTLKLLDEVFQRFGLIDKDPHGNLRRYLAGFQPAAIRRAAALFANKLERGAIEAPYAHRYLVKIIQSKQQELELERAEEELLHLCQVQNQDWTHHEEQHYKTLVEQAQEPAQLARDVAERAAHGGIPLQATFWKQKLLRLLREAPQLIEAVRKLLIRLYEAPFQQRLALLDDITALECQIA